MSSTLEHNLSNDSTLIKYIVEDEIQMRQQGLFQPHAATAKHSQPLLQQIWTENAEKLTQFSDALHTFEYHTNSIVYYRVNFCFFLICCVKCPHTFFFFDLCL
jgi:hypothetical protein